MRILRNILAALHKIHAWYYWNVRMPIQEELIVLWVKHNYRTTLPAVRARVARNGRIKVVFLIYDLAKWKSQYVLDGMISDPQFEPIVVMTAADTDWAAPEDIVRKKHAAMVEYFSRYDVPCVESYDFSNKHVADLRQYDPDIVYYSQPWGYDKRHDSTYVSRFAVTCYVPYFVPNYGYAVMDCKPLFHRSVYAYFILNKQWGNYFESIVPSWMRVGEYVPTGHPGLDYFTKKHGRGLSLAEQYVIYAPHWSVDHPNNVNSENYSTFLDTGFQMLEYAKAHPEIKWAFKPHPTLKVTLIQKGIWPRADVEAYYAEWEKIGKACYTGEYQELFLDSRLMITDCGSFLSEYGSTGKPIVWLISTTRKFKLLDINRNLYETYYKANSWQEAKGLLSELLEQNKDPDREIRHKALLTTGLTDSHAAERIVEYIGQELFRDVKHAAG